MNAMLRHSRSLRRVLGAPIIVLALVLSSCAGESDDASEDDTGTQDASVQSDDGGEDTRETGDGGSEPGISAVGVDHYGPMLPDGRNEYVIHAAHVSGKDELLFEGVEVTWADNNSAGEYVVTSETGSFNTDTKAGWLESKVRLVSPNGLVLDTERIEWDEKNTIIKSATPIKWSWKRTGSTMTGHGEGFLVNRGEGLLTIIKPRWVITFEEGEEEQ